MAKDTSGNMRLTRWTAGTDTFDYSELAQNFKLIEDHDHTSGKGVQIPTGGIQDESITSAKIAPNTIQSTDIAAGAIGADQLATDSITAAKIDFGSVNSVSTTFSGANRVDGDVIYYKPDDNADYVWQFRYTSVNNLNYWYFIGGAPIRSIYTGGAVQVNTTNYVESGSCSVTIPAGKYQVNFGGTMDLYFGSTQTTALGYIGVGSSGSNIVGDVALSAPHVEPNTSGFSQTNMGMSLSRTVVPSPFLSTTTLKIYAKASGTGLNDNGDTAVSRYFISVTPIYVTVV